MKGMLRTVTVLAVLAAGLTAGTAAGAAAALPGGASAAAAHARALTSGGTWGKAQEVRGIAALNTGGQAQITSMSCASAGNCSAGGQYATSGAQQVFVVRRVKGRWGKAQEVPGTAALNTGGLALITSLSCASAGNCSAAGQYATPSSGNFPVLQAFVVSQVKGRWGKAQEVPGTAALNTGGTAGISSLSCASAGNCSAVGSYENGSRHLQAFVVSQKHGTWGKAKKVPGLAALGIIGTLSSVSCASAGNCSAGGSYIHPAGHERAFVVSQNKGVWRKALTIPGMGYISSLSCATAGNCSAGGGAFAVSEKKGRWGKAEQVPGLAALSKGGDALITSLSCATAGNCSAGGYTHVDSYDQGFVVSQKNGTWRKARRVPGLAALTTGLFSFVIAVSCGPAGNCSAGGSYTTAHGHSQAFVVSQTKGSWGKAEKVPGTAALNAGRNAQINSVSCAPAGNCSAAGYYTDRSYHQQAFVVSQTS